MQAMGYTVRMSEEEREREYYRAIEDFFAEMRGCQHILSPKDCQLMRSWWREGVPLSAVTTGITEVVSRRRSSGEDEPVVSLSYCKLAVRKQAKRLAEMSLGQAATGTGDEAAAAETSAAVESMATALAAAAAAQAEQRPRVAAVLNNLVAHLHEAAGLPPAAVEEHLYSLEIAMLEGCRKALDEAEQMLVDEHAGSAAQDETGDSGDSTVDGRVMRAMQDREVRSLLGLPRLELGT
jgi:hypothetical protein